MGQHPKSEPARMQQALSALEHIEFLDCRLPFNLVHESIETPFILHGDRTRSIISSVQTPASHTIPLGNLRVEVPVSVAHCPSPVEIEPRSVVSNCHHSDAVPSLGQLHIQSFLVEVCIRRFVHRTGYGTTRDFVCLSVVGAVNIPGTE
ncbi:hypothetical protein PMAYCL1PPCAC_11798 [Pristionchus mayeri]|uniref:Uncharacterized protein n=1 Tax=Pristionchus mayeri TaxID=1317129 RepID=A0AAN4ZHZ9_9BILA|nr:hypothetical protein PMAYCL1PPCAC_11798 [Pristionchus mayeri]